jgi:hypothetical protein
VLSSSVYEPISYEWFHTSLFMAFNFIYIQRNVSDPVFAAELCLMFDNKEQEIIRVQNICVLYFDNHQNYCVKSKNDKLCVTFKLLWNIPPCYTDNWPSYIVTILEFNVGNNIGKRFCIKTYVYISFVLYNIYYKNNIHAFFPIILVPLTVFNTTFLYFFLNFLLHFNASHDFSKLKQILICHCCTELREFPNLTENFIRRFLTRLNNEN